MIIVIILLSYMKRINHSRRVLARAVKQNTLYCEMIKRWKLLFNEFISNSYLLNNELCGFSGLDLVLVYRGLWYSLLLFDISKKKRIRRYANSQVKTILIQLLIKRID